MIFYRYIRPTFLNELRVEIETLPRGGVCLRFESNADGTLSFTHARLEIDELFSKAVAKRISDQRASDAGRQGRFPSTQDTKILVQNVIQYCTTWEPNPHCNIAQAYYQYELLGLANALTELTALNLSVVEKAESWKSALSAANFSKHYSKKS